LADDTKEEDMLRVSFSSETTARAAVNVLAAYGYAAKQLGRDVLTECPPLLAIPAMQKQVGIGQIERLDLNGRTESTPAVLGDTPPIRGSEPGSMLPA
jgi:hypothetical protein